MERVFVELTRVEFNNFWLYTKCGGHAYHLKGSDNSQKMIKK